MYKIFNYINHFNTKLFLLIFNSFNKYLFISKIFIFIAKFSHYLFFVSYFLGFIYITFNNKNFILQYLFAPFITLLLNIILRKTFKVQRPTQKLNINSLINHSHNYGFPSNHSASSIAICLCLISISYKFKIFLLFAFLTGLSRVVVGVHYPLDILVGFFIGFLCGKILIF